MKWFGDFGSTRYMQYLATLTATLSAASVAIFMTWSSPALPQLTSENSPIGVTITSSEASWVVACHFLGALPGTCIAGWIAERFGRKKLLLFSAIWPVVSCVAIAFARSVLVLYIARLCVGVGLGGVLTGCPIYNGEVAEKDIRGKLGTTINLLKLLGSLYSLCVGPFVSYKVFTLSCGILPAIFIILFSFMPESPYYLIKVGKKDLARANLIRLSSKDTSAGVIEERLKEIESTVQYDMENKSTLQEFLTKREYRKSLVVMIGMKIFLQLGGLNAIQSYFQTIMEISDSSISPELSSIMAGLIQIPPALIAGFLVDRVGRKPLAILSSIGCAAALIAEGTYFYLKDVVKADVTNIAWLPTLGILLYLLINPLGIGTLSWVLMGELFATNIKGIAASAFAFLNCALAIVSVNFYQISSATWGLHVTFWGFGSICVLGALFSVFVLPETKGKSLAEIQLKINPTRKEARKKETQ